MHLNKRIFPITIVTGAILLSLAIFLSSCGNLGINIPITSALSTIEAHTFPGANEATATVTATITPPELPLSLPEDNSTQQEPVKSTPTITATVTPQPSLTPSPPPSTSSDLLYLTRDQLMRWDHVTQYSTLLVDRVRAYSALIEPFPAYQVPNSPDMALKKYPRLIALLRSHEISANGQELFDLDIFDLDTKTIINLYEEINRIDSMQFSLTGEKLAFIDRRIDDQVYMTGTIAGSQPQFIAKCQRDGEISCDKVAWSPDGRSLVWSDAEGIWLKDDRSATARKIQSDQVTILDPKNQECKINVSFEIISWAPDSRFLLVKIIPSAQGVQWYSVVDTRMARLIDIPNTADFSTPVSRITWTYDSNILLSYASDPENKQNPYIQLWEVVPTNNELLVAGERYDLSQNLGAELQALFTQNVIYPYWFQQLDANTFRMGLINPEGEHKAQLVEFDITKKILSEIITIPADTENVLWAPDSKGALLFGKHDQLIYASFDTQELFDLYEFIEEDAHSFQWLPTAPR